MPLDLTPQTHYINIAAGVQDKYQGWISGQSIADFASYAQVCFKAFGSKVQHWTTFNEPLTFVFQGYSTGNHAPGVLTLFKKPQVRSAIRTGVVHRAE